MSKEILYPLIDNDYLHLNDYLYLKPNFIIKDAISTQEIDSTKMAAIACAEYLKKLFVGGYFENDKAVMKEIRAKLMCFDLARQMENNKT